MGYLKSLVFTVLFIDKEVSSECIYWKSFKI